MDEEIKTIDLTPTWTEILPGLLGVLDIRLDSKSKEGAYIELKRMAFAADKWNEHNRANRD